MIDSFSDQYFFLSNFYPGDQSSLEHKYQAAKFVDPKLQKEISACKTPGQAKRHARELKAAGYQRPDWEQVNLSIMENLLKEKFSSPDLKAKLLATDGEELIEGNRWNDFFWGMTKVDGKWTGQNLLGTLLMRIRSELKTS